MHPGNAGQAASTAALQCPRVPMAAGAASLSFAAATHGPQLFRGARGQGTSAAALPMSPLPPLPRPRAPLSSCSTARCVLVGNAAVGGIQRWVHCRRHFQIGARQQAAAVPPAARQQAAAVPPAAQQLVAALLPAAQVFGRRIFLRPSGDDVQRKQGAWPRAAAAAERALAAHEAREREPQRAGRSRSRRSSEGGGGGAGGGSEAQSLQQSSGSSSLGTPERSPALADEADQPGRSASSTPQRPPPRGVA